MAYVSYLSTIASASTSPWWGVPAITGGAALFGAMVAFISAFAIDRRKAKRDKAERIMIETRTVGLEYLDSASSLARLIYTQRDPSRSLGTNEYAKAIQASLMNSQAGWEKFELFAHDDALRTGKDLSTACFVLAIEAFRGHPIDELRNFESVKYAFINTLRKASGVGEIEHKQPDPETAEKLNDGVEAVFSRLDENMKVHFNPDSPQ